MPDLLDALEKASLRQFEKDFIELARVAFGMDESYGKADESMDFYIPKYKQLLNLFNRKYPGIKLEAKAGKGVVELHIFLKHKGDVKNLLTDVAVKIAGLRSIGGTGFGAVNVEQADKFSAELNKIKNKLYLSYYGHDSGTTTIFIEFNKRKKMFELHYSFDGLKNNNSPEFKLCAYYALSQGVNKKIDVLSEAAQFGFTSELQEKEKYEWLEKFDPYFGE